jgi:hypothetical protein
MTSRDFLDLVFGSATMRWLDIAWTVLGVAAAVAVLVGIVYALGYAFQWARCNATFDFLRQKKRSSDDEEEK